MLNVTNDNKEEIKGLKLFGLLFPVRGGCLNKFLPGAPADLEPALVTVKQNMWRSYSSLQLLLLLLLLGTFGTLFKFVCVPTSEMFRVSRYFRFDHILKISDLAFLHFDIKIVGLSILRL